MSCCGQQTQNLFPLRTTPRAPSPNPSQRPPQAAIFEYIGRTALSVAGPVSGRLYRFAGPGSKERVDLRDRPGLARVPLLRDVTS